LPLLGAGIVEVFYGMILAPVMALSEAFFIGRMLTGRGLAWNAQARAGAGVGWAEACRRFWPQTVAGIVILGAFVHFAPGLLVWIIPVILGPIVVILFAWGSTRPRLGRALARARFAGIPEEYAPAPVVRAALPWLDNQQELPRRRAPGVFVEAAVSSPAD
jgi:membrane glycosyltransferase